MAKTLIRTVNVIDSNETEGSITKITVAVDGSGDYNCDGIHDEVQINQALKDISLSGGTVHLKKGTYAINSQIIIEKNGTVLEGEGIDKTIIRLENEVNWGEYNNMYDFYHGAPPLIVNANTAMHNLTFQDFTLDGNKYHQHYIINGEERQVDDGQGNYHGFKILGTSHSITVSQIYFNNMKIKNTSDDGIFTNFLKDIEVNHVIFHNVGHSGTYMVYTDGVTIKNSEFLVTANSGVRFDSSNHILVENNRIYGEIEKTGNSNFGIQITVRDAQDMPFDHVVLKKNIISHIAGAGICIDAEDANNTNNLLIQNNIIYQCGNIGTPSNRLLRIFFHLFSFIKTTN